MSRSQVRPDQPKGLLQPVRILQHRHRARHRRPAARGASSIHGAPSRVRKAAGGAVRAVPGPGAAGLLGTSHPRSCDRPWHKPRADLEDPVGPARVRAGRRGRDGPHGTRTTHRQTKRPIIRVLRRERRRGIRLSDSSRLRRPRLRRAEAGIQGIAGAIPCPHPGLHDGREPGPARYSDLGSRGLPQPRDSGRPVRAVRPAAVAGRPARPPRAGPVVGLCRQPPHGAGHGQSALAALLRNGLGLDFR